MSNPRSDNRGEFTEYKNQIYRSRTEALWAVVFDTLGIEFKYEEVTFKTPYGAYVPDFMLRKAWVEVKSVEGPVGDTARGKIEFTAGAQKKPFFVFCGKPQFRVFSDGVDMCNFGIYRARRDTWQNVVPGPRLELVQAIGGVPISRGDDRRMSIYRLNKAVGELPVARDVKVVVAQFQQEIAGWSRMQGATEK